MDGPQKATGHDTRGVPPGRRTPAVTPCTGANTMTGRCVDRRSLLAGGAAVAALAVGAPLASIVAGAGRGRRLIEPRETELELVPGRPTRSLFSYAERAPAPEL